MQTMESRRQPDAKMDEQAFKARTKRLALQVMRLVEQLPRNPVAEVLSKQLLRAATSVGANYRAACRGQSIADVVAKLSDVEEAGESAYWLELLTDGRLISPELSHELIEEANEIVAMTVASIKTLRRRR